jgi:hypothetical protein
METQEKREIVISFIKKENGEGDMLKFETKNISDIEILGALRLYEQFMSVKMLSHNKPEIE